MIIANDLKIIEASRKNHINCLELRKKISFVMRILLYFLNKVGVGKSLFYRYPASVEDDYIVVFDSGVSTKYLKKLKNLFPHKRIIFWYWNDAKYALAPDAIPDGIEKWSYSENDCKKYGLFFNTQVLLCDKVFAATDCAIDIFYVGKDKNRYADLISYQRLFEGLGLTTYFHIVGNKNHTIDKKYKKPIPYDEVQDFIVKSKCVFDFYENPNMGLSLRPLEALYFRKKLITNNANIINYDFYDPSFVFLLGDRDINGINDFLNQPIHFKRDFASYYSFLEWYKRFGARDK